MDSNDKAALLAKGIANARKVMQKVESNTTYRGGSQPNITRDMYSDDHDEREPDYLSEDQMRNRVKSVGNDIPRNTMKNLRTSKMPKEILQSFIENPIADPTAPIGLDSVVEQVAKAQPQKRIIEESEPIRETKQTTGFNMDTQLIEYIIKKTVEETLNQVNQKTSIDETIQIKIGDKVFGGKLTVLKENKTTKK
mgnify:CR=1 FL=1